MSFEQHRLWLSDQLNPSVVCQVTAGLRLRGKLDRQALRKALDRIVARHEVLRTTFHAVEGEQVHEPLQVIGAADCGFRLIEQEVAEGSDVAQICRQETCEPFDLSCGPLIRGRLLRLSDQEHVFLITRHRIICDDCSIGILLQEMNTLYCAFTLGNGDPLPPLELQYADYAAWQRQRLTAAILENQSESSRQGSSVAVAAMRMPTDRLHTTLQCYSADRMQLNLSAELTERLRELAQRQGVTLFVTLLSGWAVLLGRWSGQEEIVVGTQVANRRHPEIEPLIGAFQGPAALRVLVQEDATIEKLLKQASAVAEACSCQGISVEQMMEAIDHARNHGSPFQVMMRLNETPEAFVASAELQLLGLELSEVPIENAQTQLELSLSLRDGVDGLTGTLEYSSDLFERATIERMAACWEVLLHGMVEDVHQPISQLPILTAIDREQVLNEFNDTAVPYPQDRLMHELFEEHVRRRPEAVAVAYKDRLLTYAELNGRANQLAHYLREHGVGPDRLVGICVERGPEMVVGLLGILKAGGAYVPLDPSYPARRMEYMLADSAPVVLLTQERLKGMLPTNSALVIALDSDWDEISGRSDGNLDAALLTPQHLAYVIFTSGSTGNPKGVMVEHRNVAQFLAAADEWFHFSHRDIWTLFHSFAFDFSVLELWGSLLYGSKLVVVPYEVTRAPSELYDLLCREKITVLNQTPSAFRQLMVAQARSARSHVLKTVVLGGEALEVRSLQSWYERNAGPLPQITNMYGPTETTVFVTYRPIASADTYNHTSGSPIGSPIPHSRIYILNKHCQPVPIGVTGEIYIGGAGVARGYLNRPGLTAERFCPDPFCADPHARLYRTGDLGRWRSDGSIEYLGRNDHQVKIRGFRIELGEVEGQLVRHPQVKEAVVIAREDVPGEKRLVAYVTQPNEHRPSVEELRDHLAAVLPQYMVPSAFVALESWPLTPNGKLDRQALPAPQFGAYVSREYEAPQGEREEVLAKIWQGLLRMERVGRQDNFFELGGHSLQIVQMLERLRQVGVSVEMRDVFQSRTLADLARVSTSEAVEHQEAPPNLIPAVCEAITPQMLPLVELRAEQIERIVKLVPGGAANIKDIYPLTPLQEGMLFHHLLDGQGGDTYVMPTVLSVSSRERLQELIAALQRVIDRHDILRTAVLWEGLPHSVQVVYRQAKLPVEEIVLDPGRNLTEQIDEWVKPERQRLDLWQAPLMRLQVAADTHSGQWYALLQVHHIVDDAVSLKILISEVVAYLGGRAEELPEPVPYREHVAQTLVYARTHDAEAFFQSRLNDIDEPTAPFGLLDVHGPGSRIDEASQDMELSLAQRVRVQARRLSVSVATLFHAAWGLVVARTSGRDDAVFGSVLLGRLHGSAGAQRIMGMFVNTLPLRLRLQTDTAVELVEQTRRELVELLSHEQASLVIAQRCSGMAGSAPLFSAVLNYRHSVPDPEAEWASADGIRVLAFQYRTNYPITISVDDLGEGFGLTAQTERRIDPARVINYLQTAIQSLVEALELAPQTPAWTLSILPAGEKEQVTRSFNATQVAYPHEKLIHELFEEQVERTPDATAVLYEGQSLTYAELNGRANQLARYLKDKGVGPDQLVGICVERSVEMVVGLLGILKAGGAYVPLDPCYPAERLAYMLEDAAPSVLLTQERLRGRLQGTSAEVIALDNDWSAIAERLTSNLDSRALGQRSDQLAYVIYTSGSTGQPKGVMIEHRNIASLWQGLEHIYRDSPCQRIAVNASFNFDASVKQFVQLLSGRTIVLVPQEVRWDASMLLDFIDEHRIDGIDCTPSQLKAWVAAGLLKGNRCRLRVALVGGEAIDAELWSSLAQCSEKDFYNVYGPTESTVDTTFAHLQCNETAPHIGRPMENRRVYILDRHGQPLPIGVAGEMHIGGAGVARGYLNRPELTAERFVADPFSADPQARLYKTGDLGRWRSDGAIEYLGRNDHQVKVRGHRIELGEIEAQLGKHAQVKDAIVLARDDERGEKRLVAYVTADVSRLKVQQQEGSQEASADIVAQWKSVHNETYLSVALGPSFIGWNSSYTGEPIGQAQMQEWLACTVERIQALQPKKVLEIGCGVGLVLQHVAPHCTAYTGTDFAAAALEQLGNWMSGREDLKHVELLQRSATELQDLKSASFDTVVLNSVVQYFPDIDYLISVLQEAVRLLTPGGRIFIGDVRHLGLLSMFHSAVQLSKAGATVSVGQLRARIGRAMAQDKELVIDPQFFQALPGRVPGISAVEVQLKRGRAPNELTRYRYDVVLHTGEQVGTRTVCEPLEWHAAVGSATQLEAALRERRWCAVRLHSIPNPRLAREVTAQRLIETSDERLEASALRRQLNELQFDEVDPEKFWELGQVHGYDVTVSPDEQGCCFEVQLLDRARVDQAPRAVLPTMDTGKPWSAYANDPLENGFSLQLIPQLRDYLKGRLPEYMIPTAWMVLRQLPLTPNGKVDRSALPNPQGRPEEMGEYVVPRTEVERTLADLWAQLLQVDQVGVQDNFFELGGHSLHAMKLIAKVEERLMVRLSAIAVFEYPTIRQMAMMVDSLRLANDQMLNSEGMEFSEGVI